MYNWFHNRNKENANSTGNKKLPFWQIFANPTAKKRPPKKGNLQPWQKLCVARYATIKPQFEAAFAKAYPRLTGIEARHKKIAFRQAFFTDLYNALSQDEKAQIDETEARSTRDDLSATLGIEGQYVENQKIQE